MKIEALFAVCCVDNFFFLHILALTIGLFPFEMIELMVMMMTIMMMNLRFIMMMTTLIMMMMFMN